MLYFAYGSNLSKKAMSRRAPKARALMRAHLPNHRLTFESNEPTGLSDRAFANVRPHAGSTVPGALYEVDEAGMRALDRYEDVDLRVYVRVEVDVICPDGQKERAIVYRMPVEDREPRRGDPSGDQLGQIRAGYKDWNLDATVIDEALEAG